MHDLTGILLAIEHGDPDAGEQLMSLIYEELHRVATMKLAHERFSQNLQATALVHEAYLRLFKDGNSQHWNSRGHFFSAASEAMRRILIEQSRRRLAAKRGGDVPLEELRESQIYGDMPDEELIALSEALEQFEQVDKPAALIVRLRFFGGLTMIQAAEVIGVSERSAYELWSYARSWLKHKLREE